MISRVMHQTTDSIARLLAGAKAGDEEKLGQLLELYRNYLTILATTQLNARLRQRVSPSDIVQEAMLCAYREFVQFCGGSEPELVAWLRTILISCLYRAYEVHMQAKRRDVRRDVSLDEVNKAFDHSVVRLAHVLADKGPSPSTSVARREHSLALADQLGKLRREYQDVIVLRNLQGLSFEEIAVRLGRKPGTVRMQWLRAIEKLRDIYEAENE